jgi:uncharacterized membrane protein
MHGNGLVDLVTSAQAQIVWKIAACAILAVLGYYTVGKLRSALRESERGPSDFMSNFRELHSQGELSDEEYRTIKAMLAARLRERISESPKKNPRENS